MPSAEATLPGSAPANGPMVPLPFEVISRRQDAGDTWTLALASRSGEPLAFEPGQCTMLAAAGAGEVPISISGDCEHPELLVHTVRAVGLATAKICATDVGGVLSVRGPFGNPWPIASLEGSDVIFCAGGIGLPPLRPAILWALARRERYGRLILMYGGRSPDQLLYGEELERWRERGLEVMLTVDSAGPEWLGPVGVVTRLVRRAAIDADPPAPSAVDLK